MTSSAINPSADSEWTPDSGAGENLAADRERQPAAKTSQRNPEQDSLPDHVGRYRILKQLGKGGFGFVYLAEDPELHRKVAIKVPRWDRPLTASAVERFLKEGKLLAQIEHPGIVAVHDLGETSDHIPYVVMKYVEGKTLEKLLKSHTLTMSRTLKVLLQIAAALREAHKETIVHRDFKPSNVIIDARGRVHLVDFGMALHDDLTLNDFQQRGAMGTPLYMAPEQVRGENHRIDGRTDIWAFGVTMYQMLTGHNPFREDDTKALRKAICYRNPRPLRQLNEDVSPELERICLRCLSKLMDERYQSMADLMDELQAASVENTPDATIRSFPETAGNSTQWSVISKSASFSGVEPSADRFGDSLRTTGESRFSMAGVDQLYFVPKGLRAFDENDSEFFLRLLPGPTNRLGIPESIGFWTGRLGLSKQVEQIPIGLIIGPSGSGKSSFVRAGLIPRIQHEAIPVYIDCTSADLPNLIQNRLARQLGDEFRDEDLAGCIRNIRQAADDEATRKVVLVLDQFEQWLESCEDWAEAELTKALRQCEAESIQCLILIRDDYWMSITSFMKCLDQKIEEGKNTMSLPLFDRRHARRVLRSYGRHIGALPESGELNRAQKRFIREAIESISQNGRVLCVHLTILSDMLADTDWGKTSFNKALGSESIGTVFLERHLNENTRVNKSNWLPVCESLFEQLLPVAGETSIKGRERARSELLAACQTAPGRVDDCLDYLTRELKLITEVDRTEGAKESGYRLTHDYFVIPIQLWLNRRRSATVAGRTRTRFDQLCHQYQIAKSRRYLPGPVEYLMSLVWVRRSQLSPEGKEFFVASHRYYLTRTTVLALFLTAVVLAGSIFWSNQRADQTHAALYVGNTESAIDTIERMGKGPLLFIEDLRDNSTSDNPVRAIRSSAALSAIQPDNPEYLTDLLNLTVQGGPQDFPLFTLALLGFYDQALANELIVQQFMATEDLTTRCRLASLQLVLNQDSLITSLFEDVSSPDGRTEFADAFTDWHIPLSEFCNWLDGDHSPNVVFGAFETLSFVETRHHDPANRRAVADLLEKHYQDPADAGVSSIIEFCARQWQIPLATSSSRDFFGDRLPGCSVTPNQLIYVAGGELKQAYPPKGVSGTVAIDPFFVSATEVTLGMFHEFVESLPSDDSMRTRLESLAWWDKASEINRPVRELLAIEICAYLNWLSNNHQPPLTAVYEIPVEANEDAIIKTVPGANGFRLPTANESEWISNGGAIDSTYSWGDLKSFSDDPSKLQRIAFRYQTNNYLATHNDWSDVTAKAPNRLGFYECLGNADELCQDNRDMNRPGIMTYMRGNKDHTPNAIESGSFLPFSPRFPPTGLGFRIARDASARAIAAGPAESPAAIEPESN